MQLNYLGSQIKLMIDEEDLNSSKSVNQINHPEQNSDDHLKNLKDYIEQHSESEIVIFGFYN
jgi:hypothetical protein